MTAKKTASVKSTSSKAAAKAAPAKAESRPTAKGMKAAAQKLPYPAAQADMKLQPDSDLANYRAREMNDGEPPQFFVPSFLPSKAIAV